MLRIALIYGVISGAIIIGVITFGVTTSGGGDFSGSQAFGYLIMLLGLSLIFFGVKRYRDRDLGGVIKFMPALLLGLAISAVAGVAYVAVWEAYLASSGYSYINDYTAGVIEAKKASGTTGAELDALISDMENMTANYAKPYFRLPMTFLEIFPVGLIVSLISAALLRNPKILPAR